MPGTSNWRRIRRGRPLKVLWQYLEVCPASGKWSFGCLPIVDKRSIGMVKRRAISRIKTGLIKRSALTRQATTGLCHHSSCYTGKVLEDQKEKGRGRGGDYKWFFHDIRLGLGRNEPASRDGRDALIGGSLPWGWGRVIVAVIGRNGLGLPRVAATLRWGRRRTGLLRRTSASIPESH